VIIATIPPSKRKAVDHTQPRNWLLCLAQAGRKLTELKVPFLPPTIRKNEPKTPGNPTSMAQKCLLWIISLLALPCRGRDESALLFGPWTWPFRHAEGGVGFGEEEATRAFRAKNTHSQCTRNDAAKREQSRTTRV